MRSTWALFGLVVALGLALERSAPEPFVARSVILARAHWQAGETAIAKELATAALPELRAKVAAHPEDVFRHMAFAEALALAGENTQALTEADRAIAADLAPWATRPRSTRDRESLLETSAVVATEAGAPERALAALDRLLAHSTRFTADQLRVDPRFTHLHPDARFTEVLTAHARSGDGSQQHRQPLMQR